MSLKTWRCGYQTNVQVPSFLNCLLSDVIPEPGRLLITVIPLFNSSEDWIATTGVLPSSNVFRIVEARAVGDN